MIERLKVGWPLIVLGILVIAVAILQIARGLSG